MKYELEKKIVEIKGRKIEVFEMTGRQRKELPKQMEEGVDLESFCIQVCAPEFKDMSIEEILDLPSSIYTAVSDAVLKLSGLSSDANEEAAKNS